VYYSLAAAGRILDTPIPQDVRRRAARWAPPALVAALMTRLIDVTLSKSDRSPVIAQWALYVRSHWLRMPPLQLAGHLFKKATRRSAQ